jgi:hypothetical protein
MWVERGSPAGSSVRSSGPQVLSTKTSAPSSTMAPPTTSSPPSVAPRSRSANRTPRRPPRRRISRRCSQASWPLLSRNPSPGAANGDRPEGKRPGAPCSTSSWERASIPSPSAGRSSPRASSSSRSIVPVRRHGNTSASPSFASASLLTSGSCRSTSRPARGGSILLTPVSNPGSERSWLPLA